MNQKRYLIAEFSELTGISRKALRIYEEKEILVPHRNPDNSYRFYYQDDLQAASEIKKLKNLGFTLEKIKEVLEKGYNNSKNLYEKNPDFLFLLAWNFADEIISKTEKYKSQGGRYIIPLPNIQII